MAFNYPKVLFVVLAWTCSSLGNAETPEPVSSASASQAGKERFIDACAFCHGLSGKGDGAAANFLEKEPANLTLLSKKNKGVFPLAELYQVIDGRMSQDSHGGREMPVWGDVWARGAPPEYAEYYVKGRVLELILYLDSIQEL